MKSMLSRMSRRNRAENQFGSNALTPPEQTSFWRELWDTFRGDALVRILTVALVITILFAIFGVGALA